MDTVVYEQVKGFTPVYVIQFREIDGEWLDSAAPQFNSKDRAIEYLDAMNAAPYPYRVVERTK